VWKIKANVLKEYMMKINIDKTIEEPVIKSTDNGLVAVNTDPTDIFLSEVKLNKNAFQEYNKVNHFGLFHLSKLIDLLSSFGSETLSIDFKENYIKITGKTDEAEFVLPDLEIFEEKLNLQVPEIPFDIEIDITRDFLTRIGSAISIVEAKFVKLYTIGNILVCEAGETDKIKRKLLLKDNLPELNVTVIKEITNITAVLGENIKLKAKTNTPLQFEEKSKYIEAKYLIAPLVGEDLNEQ